MSSKTKFESEVRVEGRITIPVVVRRRMKLQGGDIVEVEVTKHVRLNPSTGWFEEVSVCGDICPEESADEAASQHDPLSPSHKPRIEEHAVGLPNVFSEAEEARRAAQRRRETGR